jgi:hypothetical protein
LYVAREIAAYIRPGSQVAEVRCRQADWRVAASTGARIVTASDDKTARIWDTRLETMPAGQLGLIAARAGIKLAH